jgi:hypothetical protein
VRGGMVAVVEGEDMRHENHCGARNSSVSGSAQSGRSGVVSVSSYVRGGAADFVDMASAGCA